MTAAVNRYPVDDVVGRRAFVPGADQVHLPAAGRRRFQDVVQVQLGPTAEGVIDIPPVQRQDLQDAASGLRAITPMVGVV